MVKNDPKRLYGLENLPFSTIFGPFWGLFFASVTHIGLKKCSHIPKWSLECSGQLTLTSIWSTSISFGQKQPQRINFLKFLYVLMLKITFLFKVGWKHYNDRFAFFQIWFTSNLYSIFYWFSRPEKCHFGPKRWFYGIFFNFSLIFCHIDNFSWILLGMQLVLCLDPNFFYIFF